MPDPFLPPLLALMRMRRVGVSEARLGLVARLDAQTAADREVANIERRMAREAEAAANISTGDGTVEAYGRWLGLARREAEAAREVRERAWADTAVARARLAASRAAVEAVRSVVDRREAEAEAEAARREQAVIDEMTRSRRPAPKDAG